MSDGDGEETAPYVVFPRDGIRFPVKGIHHETDRTDKWINGEGFTRIEEERVTVIADELPPLETHIEDLDNVHIAVEHPNTDLNASIDPWIGAGFQLEERSGIERGVDNRAVFTKESEVNLDG